MPVRRPGPDPPGRTASRPASGRGPRSLLGCGPRPTDRPALLVLRALGLGDLLTAVPALRALRRAHPGHDLVLAAPAWLADAAAATGAVDRLLPTGAPGRAVPDRLDWPGPPPELAVDLHGNGPPSHRLLRALRPARLFGYAHRDTPGLAGPAWREDEHERDRWCRLVAWYGVPADPADLRIAPPGGPRPAPGAVVVHPGADAGARRWPAERFAAVAGALRAAGERVVVTAGAREGPLARTVAARAGLPPSAVVGGDRDVPFADLCALVDGARAVVVGDTGLAHLATALGTPSVVLFGPVSPLLWGPPRTPRHRALWVPDAPEIPDVRETPDAPDIPDVPGDRRSGHAGGPPRRSGPHRRDGGYGARGPAGDPGDRRAPAGSRGARCPADGREAPADGVRPGDAHGSTPDERLLRIGVREVLAALSDVARPAEDRRADDGPPARRADPPAVRAGTGTR